MSTSTDTKAAAAAKISIAFAAAKFCLQLVALTPYGYFRDELYYLACANHLDWGYVDHPPLSIAVLAAWRAVFGDSIAAIRIIPALAGALLVFGTGLVALELGGGAVAAGVACFSLFCAPALAGVDHIYSMNAIDHAFWCASALLLLRTLDAPSPKRWVALGVVLGFGLDNKIDVLWLGAGIAVSLVALAELRSLLKTRGPTCPRSSRSLSSSRTSRGKSHTATRRSSSCATRPPTSTYGSRRSSSFARARWR